MASLRQIRSRLRSIQSTKQIMRAMQLVSASKLKRAQGRWLQARVVLEFLEGLLGRVWRSTDLSVERNPEHAPRPRPWGHVEGRVSPQAPEARRRRNDPQPLEHPLCAIREGLPTLLVLFTSDAGLCGSYNANLIQLAESYLRRDSPQQTQLIYIGKKGYRYFTKRGYAAADSYLDLAGRPNIAKAEEIGRALMQRFLDPSTRATEPSLGIPPHGQQGNTTDVSVGLHGPIGSIQLLYSQFRSATSFKPTITQWLPIRLDAVTQSPSHPVTQLDYIFEPSPERVFDDLLPRWALATFRLVMLEAFTSEHSARMIAMKNATDNAEEILKNLTTQRNKIRQAAITKELAEIVGTAEALK